MTIGSAIAVCFSGGYCLFLCNFATKRLQDYLGSGGRSLEEWVDTFLDVLSHFGNLVLKRIGRGEDGGYVVDRGVQVYGDVIEGRLQLGRKGGGGLLRYDVIRPFCLGI